ncbi:MAG: pphA2 [Ferruginibacter sp.]|nr:pphA2 [Ferruginibacter sp.]
MKRSVVIGDIHGGLKALQQVFHKANITVADRLIFLGDYVDGWSESAAVINYMITLNNTNECIFIKGNHDLWCEEWLRTGIPDTTWVQHGGKATIDSYANVTVATRL